MGLYERNYLKGLTTEEEKEYNAVLQKEIEEAIGGIKLCKYHLYPKAAKHYYHSLFPNQFLDVEDIRNNDSLSTIIEKFTNLINDPKTNEEKILKFIRDNRYYPLIGALLKDYHFGHHAAYLFKEFPLGTSYKADYLLIGACSEGYHLVFVELEDVNGKATRNDGKFSVSSKKGIDQVNDWKRWMASNYSNLKETFNKYKLDKTVLPRELIEYNPNRIHYVVICGRRNDYTQTTYEERMQYRRENHINILHYDNLIDLATQLNSNDRNY